MRLSVIFIVLLCSFAAFADSASLLTVAKARTLESAGNYVAAARLYRSVTSETDTREAATLGYARCLIASQKLDDAKDALTDFIEAFPFQVDAHLLLSDIYFEKDKIEDAASILKKVETLRPGYVHIFARRGAVEFKKGEYVAAIQSLSEALKSEAQQDSVRLYRARSYAASEAWAQAASDYKTLVETKSNDLQVQIEYASVLRKLGRNEEAERTLNDVLKVDPRNLFAAENLFDLHAAHGPKDVAIADAKRVLSLDPKKSSVSVWLAKIYKDQGNWRGAVEVLESDLKLSLDSIPSAQLIVVIWKEQKYFDRVGAFLKDYTERKPAAAWAAIEYSQLLSRIGDAKGAEKALGRFRKKSSLNQTDEALLIAAHHYLTGEAAEAVKVLRAAEQMSPSDSRVKYNLGIALTRVGELQNAVDAYKDVAKSAPFYFKARFNLAALQQELKLGNEELSSLQGMSPDQLTDNAVRERLNEINRKYPEKKR